MTARFDRLLEIRQAPADVVQHYRTMAGETLGVLLRRWHWIAGVVLLGVALCCIALALLPRKYSAEALIQFDFVRVGAEAGSLIATVDATALAENEVRLIRARSTARNIVLRLGLHERSPGQSADVANGPLARLRESIVPEMASLDAVERTVSAISRHVTVTNVPRAYLITIAYSGRSPAEAALIANEFGREFFRVKLLQGLQKREAAAQREVQRLGAIYGDRHPLMTAALENLEAVKAQARADRAALAEPDVLPPPGFSFTSAQPNPVPSSPRGLLVLGLGTIGALCLGIALAIWVDRLNGGFYSAREVQAACGVRCLGMVWDLQDAQEQGSAAQCDALQALSLAMELATTGGTPRTFLITAAKADGSDKLLAAALAEWVGSTGQRVLSIDAAAPDLTIAPSGGWYLERALADADSARKFLAEHAGQQHAKLARGIAAGDAGPLASSRSFADLLAAASKEYALILITAPPVLARSDALLLGRAVDVCVLAARSRTTPRRAVMAAIQRLREARARIDGVVLARNWPRRSVSERALAWWRYLMGQALAVQAAIVSAWRGRTPSPASALPEGDRRPWMRGGQLLGRATWALADQAVVSLGSVLIHLLLARNLPLAEYGEFALLSGGLLALQIVNASLFSYPLAVRLAGVKAELRPHVVSGTIAMVVASSFLLNLLLIAGVLAFGLSSLILPVSVYFLLWQLQEALRRGLLADFQYRKATGGDAVAYLGGPLLALILSLQGEMSLDGALYAMAAAFGMGALLHALRQNLRHPILLINREVIGEIYRSGRWFLVTSVLILLGIQLPLWTLAALGGAVEAAALQAVLNIGNLLNPMIIGLGNAVPQGSAEARLQHGIAGAWRATRGYILVGLVPTVVLSVFAIAFPQLPLQLFYGSLPAFLALTLSVQLLILAWPARFTSELICTFMVSVDAGRQAVLTHLAGIGLTMVALPFAAPLGVPGFCLALGLGAIARLVVGYLFVRNLVAAQVGQRETEVVPSVFVSLHHAAPPRPNGAGLGIELASERP